MKWPAHPCHFCETMWKNRLSISICFCITTLQLVKWKQKLSVIDFENTLYETPGFLSSLTVYPESSCRLRKFRDWALVIFASPKLLMFNPCSLCL